MKIKTIKSFDPEAPNLLEGEWADGQKFVFDVETCPPEVCAQLLYHGFKQKLMDEHSGTYKETGSVAACRMVTEDLYARLVDGDWGASRSMGGWVVEAIAEILDIELSEALEKWEGLDEAGQKAMRSHAEVKAWKARRDLARAEAKSGGENIAELF
jgi:hypothetical protein